MLTRISFSAWAKSSGVTAGPAAPAASPGVPEKMLPVPVRVPASGAARTSAEAPAATPASASAPSARNRRRDLCSAMVPFLLGRTAQNRPTLN
jgi:hypothetical protein